MFESTPPDSSRMQTTDPRGRQDEIVSTSTHPFFTTFWNGILLPLETNNVSAQSPIALTHGMIVMRLDHSNSESFKSVIESRRKYRRCRDAPFMFLPGYIQSRLNYRLVRHLIDIRSP